MAAPGKNALNGKGEDISTQEIKTGDQITYKIEYANATAAPATIKIIDSLPSEVNFVGYPESSVRGVYDDIDHTVTWLLENVPAQETGSVFVIVEVSEEAIIKIVNNATITVNGGTPADVSVENRITPSDPVKKALDNNGVDMNGKTVKAGDLITYEIAYQNYTETAADISITDRLPVGVDFEGYSQGSTEGVYNMDTHTVTWTINAVPSTNSGKVSIIVSVNTKAVFTIQNYATVKVGTNNPRFTNGVTNTISGSCLNIKQTTKCRKIIKGRKIWSDNENANNTRPPSVEIVLLKDREVYKSISIDSTGNGGFVFVCLPIRKNSNHLYEYQIDEPQVPNGYRKSINGYNVTNTLNGL